jgi:hypothetical protein
MGVCPKVHMVFKHPDTRTAFSELAKGIYVYLQFSVPHSAADIGLPMGRSSNVLGFILSEFILNWKKVEGPILDS